MLTIFTPTYNRAHTLPRLYASLLKQDNKDFEWIVVDDGSTDETKDLFEEWMNNNNGFPIRYQVIVHGGKQRAINWGVSLSQGFLFFIVDSDDYLTPGAVSFIFDAYSLLPRDSSFVGLSGLKGDINGHPLGKGFHVVNNVTWVDASNIERKRIGLDADMAEVFLTEVLLHYPFPVWKGETFTPEDVVWDKIALDGYKLRWYNRIICVCDYQKGGLSDSFWKLLKDNPMGYALLFDTKLKSAKGLKKRLHYLLDFLSCCFLGKEWRFIKYSCSPLWAFTLSPAGFLLYKRRSRQIKHYLQ